MVIRPLKPGRKGLSGRCFTLAERTDNQRVAKVPVLGCKTGTFTMQNNRFCKSRLAEQPLKKQK